MNVLDLLQSLVNGALLGGVYGGLAVGLSLLLGVLRIVNLAHSAVLMFAGLFYWQLVSAFGFDPLLMIIPVVAVAYFFGLGVHRGIAQYISRESDTTVILAFFGLMVILESIAIMIWKTDPRTVNLGYLGGIVTLGPLNVPVSRIVAAVITFAVLIALHLFLTRTLTGSAIRGMAQNRDVAEMAGINVNKLSRRVFAAGIALAAFGGTVLGLVSTLAPQEHLRWLAWAFLVVILGGLGSVMRTLVAGIGVGIFETVVGLLIPFQFTYLALYALLAVVLLIRNEGLGSIKQRTL
jgi:branched-chain amino acid transport system permease protein